MKKIIGVLLVSLMLFVGCTNSETGRFVEQQNSEVVALQEMRRSILARPASTAEELSKKQAELKIVNEQIAATQGAQRNAQTIQDRKLNNLIKGTITGAGAVLGTAAVIHNVTK